MNEQEKETKAWRRAYPQFLDKIPAESVNLQNVFTPYDLCYDIVRKLESYTGFKDKTFCVFNLEFAEVLCYDFGVQMEKIWFVTDCEEKSKFTKVKRYNKINTILVPFGEFLKENKMKFSVVIQNPPYQAPKAKEHEGRGKCGTSLWEAFVEKSLSIVEDNGFICNIHPSRWRKPNSKIGRVIRSKQLHYLEMHKIEDGFKTFGCNTEYDWYVLKNTSCKGKTVIVDQKGFKGNFTICKMPFIPDSKINEVMSLVAKDGEEKVEVLWDCTYHTQTRAKDGTMSREKKGKFKYPCIYSVSIKNEPSFWHSSKQEQYFGIPKIVWGNGHTGVFIDKDGKFGLTQFAYAIVDKVHNLKKIEKALRSQRFIDNIMSYKKGFGHAYDKKIIETLRKDFWKEFV